MRTVPYSVTEEAVRLLRFTHADFSKIPHPTVRSRRRSPGGGALSSYDFVQVRSQSAYLRLVSIVEAYVDTVSSRLFDRRVVGIDRFYGLLAEAAHGRSTTGWSERKDCFKTYHGFSLTDSSAWQDIDGAIEVRNSIAHGLGRLTRRQTSGSAKAKIAACGVALRDDELVISQAALGRCLAACVQFVQDLDAKLPRPW